MSTVYCEGSSKVERPVQLENGGSTPLPSLQFVRIEQAQPTELIIKHHYPVLRVVPLHLRQANDLVAKMHRHHKPLRIAKFSIGLESNDILVAAAICMRPCCRALDDGKTLEVARLVSDGSKNACSKLYSACARIAKEMGYEKIQTYILDSEAGTSLRASGWALEATGCGGTPQGKRTKRPNGHEATMVTLESKQRWAKKL